MSETVRIATYTRISTDETNQPYSLGAQRDRLDAFVASQPGWRTVARFTDQASGKSLERPALAELRAAAAGGRFDLLLVYRVDRLSRNLAQLVGLIEELADAGVGFRSATEPFDTANPAGRMLVQLLGSFAEFERASLLDRIGAGVERKAARGEWTGQGYRTRTGGRWSTTSMLGLLRNRAYVGEVSFRRVWGPGAHAPIVERDLFDAAQTILDARAGDRALRRSNPSDYLLSTLHFVCDRCGHPMIGERARGRNGVRYDYYTCVSRGKRGRAGCDQPRLPMDELEAALLAQMAEVYADTDLVGAALDELAAAERTVQAEAERERARLRRDAAELRRRLGRYYAAFEAGELDAGLVQERVSELERQLTAMEARLAERPRAEGEATAKAPIDAALVSWALSESAR